MGREKTEHLYKMAKPTAEKRDKSKVDYEFERNGSDCTFKPNIE
jgi:hypothetical protein